MWRWIGTWNTLRNQMLAGFVLVMLIVLVSAGIVTFRSVSTLLKDKAGDQMKQTAVQANGRLDAFISQIDMLTLQAVNDAHMQALLLSMVQGEELSFSDRQSFSQIANHIQNYSKVSSVEVYTTDQLRVYPLGDRKLTDRVEPSWVERADRGKGRLVWIGVDPKDDNSVLAIRRIGLFDRWFSNGGYVLVRLDRHDFNFQDPAAGSDHPEFMLLADQAGRPIVSDDSVQADWSGLLESESQTVTLADRRYLLVKQQSEQTGWTLMLLYPVTAITDGISVLRVAILASGSFGLILFAILSFLLSTMITRPLLRLMKAMRNTRQGVLTPNPAMTYTLELRDLNTTYNHMVENMNELIKLVYEKEIIQSRIELQALQAQINPHFLYNTLEAVYWSLQEKGEEDMSELIIDVSDLFRYVIGGPNQSEWVTLRDELDHVERYLRIMGVRFGDRLDWLIEAEAGHSHLRLPKLLIQPLVENAILHGIEGKTGKGIVKVRVELTKSPPQALRITVSDDGPGIGEEALQRIKESMAQGADEFSRKGSGMAISNVERRLQLYYPQLTTANRRLTISSAPGRGTSVSFDIPLEEEQESAFVS
ncbi:sensor histidine kinase [Paenibacillus puerhi]|uniref:sensor histidine kinase n=1 Tax=Paenibacillus puerhi TaxID=2692622 RepID=UPI00135A4A39|nr:sensor histidine kinase [Paenibacillus puerhi]